MEDSNVLKSSQFGRQVPKPEVAKDDQVEMEKFFADYDDAGHVEARIEHMKAKLMLKRKVTLNLQIIYLRYYSSQKNENSC